MTLAAISKDRTTFNPSAMISEGLDPKEAVSVMRAAQQSGLYCPFCFEVTGEFVPVRFRNSEVRRKHFFHSDRVNEGTQCSNYSPESEKHLNAKSWLHQHIAGVYVDTGVEVKAIIEQQLRTDGVTTRTPDVLVIYPNGAHEAHEIQISPISSEQIAQRTKDLKSHGCAVVKWYLYGKAYSRTNREYSRLNGITVFKLWFDVDGVPLWEEDTSPVSRKSSQSSPGGRDRHSKPSKSVDQRLTGLARNDFEHNKSSMPPVARNPVEVWSTRIPMDKTPVTHPYRKGWVGYVYEIPWNMPEMSDVIWVWAPQTPDGSLPDIPLYPVRYPSAKLQEVAFE